MGLHFRFGKGPFLRLIAALRHPLASVDRFVSVELYFGHDTVTAIGMELGYRLLHSPMALLAVLSLLLAFASFGLGVVLPTAVLLANRRIVLANEDGHVSGIPFVGSILGLFALLLAPMGSLGERFAWSWVPFAAEAVVFGLSLAYWHLSGLGTLATRRRKRQP